MSLSPLRQQKIPFLVLPVHWRSPADEMAFCREIIEAAHLKTVAKTAGALRNGAFNAAVVLACQEVPPQSAIQNTSPELAPTR